MVTNTNFVFRMLELLRLTDCSVGGGVMGSPALGGAAHACSWTLVCVCGGDTVGSERLKHLPGSTPL